MNNIKLEVLKEKYDTIYQLYSKLPKELQRDFFHRIKECKTLKNKRLNSATLVSKNYLLNQVSKKLQIIHSDLIKTKSDQDSKDFKLEAERLKKVFDQNKNLSNDEKQYLIKKRASLAGFNEIDFQEYMITFTDMAKSIGNDINNLLTVGISQ